MNTPESLYRYLQKIGPSAFYAWLDEHQEFKSLMPQVDKMDQNKWKKDIVAI